MSPISDGSSRPLHSKDSHGHGEKAKWVLIAAGALLSSLSIRLGYILKHALDEKAKDCGHANAGTSTSGNVHEKRVFDESRISSKIYSFPRDEAGCFTCIVGNEDALDTNQSIIMTAPDHQEKLFRQSNSSESICMSESVSEIFTKREVLQKLRDQLKKRDEMILEMQTQIVELESSLSSQLSHSSRLQSLLDTANRNLFDSNREILTLRRVVAEHCIISHLTGNRSGNGESAGGRPWTELSLKEEEVGELKEVIEGKDYLLRSYKEEKEALSLKLKELQGKLNSQL